MRGPSLGFADGILKALAETVPKHAEPEFVADAVVAAVNAPFGRRPFRVVIDSASDGSAVSYAAIDRVRAEFLHRIGFADLMQPKDIRGNSARVEDQSVDGMMLARRPSVGDA